MVNNAAVFGRILPETTWSIKVKEEVVLATVKSIWIDSKSKPIVIYFIGTNPEPQAAYLAEFMAQITHWEVM